MPVLLLLFTLAMTYTVWKWRMRMTAEATHEVADAVLSAKASYKRWMRNKSAKDAPFQAVEDPCEASTVLMLLIARLDGDFTARQLDAIQLEMQKTMKMGERAHDAFHFARWLASLAPSTQKAIALLAPLLNRSLKQPEKEDLIRMLERVATIEGPENALQTQAIAALRQQLRMV